MQNLTGLLGTMLDLLLVILGFGLIILIHELGHFVAARWAGIRVLAFAIGFGPAIASYRKGLGWRRGSSEREYIERIARHREGIDQARGPDINAFSPTEYRLNFLPFGGYVKMLGQDDMDPGAVSTESDSYQSCKPWKRMIVISAGVVMNVILAALLFIAVFMIGLKVEPAQVGAVQPGSPAATAVAVNASELGITEPGLHSGDRITSINGREPNSFSDLILATAMARRGEPIKLTVARDGSAGPLDFRITPEKGRLTGLLELGIEPARSATIPEARTPAERDEIIGILDRLGLKGVEPGMKLIRAGADTEIRDGHDLETAMRTSGGAPVQLDFAAPDGRKAAVTLEPRAQSQTALFRMPDGSRAGFEHLLGLTPVLKVAATTPAAEEKGLREGDIFARIGTLEFPSMPAGIGEFRASKGRTIDIVVLRAGPGGSLTEVPLKVRVGHKGTIGFMAADTSDVGTWVTPPPSDTLNKDGAENGPLPASTVIRRPGLRITAIDDKPVADFSQIRAALLSSTADAFRTGTSAEVKLTAELPTAGAPAAGPVAELAWTLSSDAVKSLYALGWESPVGAGPFDPVQVTLRGENPVDAIRLGLEETHRVMMTTYATFARLFEGTVKVEHLKGPVGIAHLGTILADRGLVWLLFFMALISVNLAVINFLPLPIVDGGQFIFLVLEQIRGKPVPIPVQNAATIAGLVLIGSVFLIVTFNDVATLFGR
ncbi:MAG: site-2 protease family protein [Phycisphaerales bacterium]|nr:site-2 protease family protein [Phycisphaerales bacterium]